VFLVRGAKITLEVGGDFCAPLGPLGGCREQFELENDAWSAKSHGAAQDVLCHLFVVGLDIGPSCVVDGDWREGEVDFREHRVPANRQT
jgi:hypothetical protein